MAPYKDHPARKRAQAAPKAKNLPKDIGQWCSKIPSEEKGKYPIDQIGRRRGRRPDRASSLAGQAQGHGPQSQGALEERSIAGLTIRNEDAISDSGVEIWNLLEDRKH